MLIMLKEITLVWEKLQARWTIHCLIGQKGTCSTEKSKVQFQIMEILSAGMNIQLPYGGNTLICLMWAFFVVFRVTYTPPNLRTGWGISQKRLQVEIQSKYGPVPMPTPTGGMKGPIIQE